MNSENSKPSDEHRLSNNLEQLTNTQVISIPLKWNNKKSRTKATNLKNQEQHGMKSLISHQSKYIST